MPEVSVSWHRAYKEVLRLSEDIRKGGALTQQDWRAYKKRKLAHKASQRAKPVRTQGKDVHLQAKPRGLRKNQLCQRLDLRPPTSRT